MPFCSECGRHKRKLPKGGKLNVNGFYKEIATDRQVYDPAINKKDLNFYPSTGPCTQCRVVERDGVQLIEATRAIYLDDPPRKARPSRSPTYAPPLRRQFPDLDEPCGIFERKAGKFSRGPMPGYNYNVQPKFIDGQPKRKGYGHFGTMLDSKSELQC